MNVNEAQRHLNEIPIDNPIINGYLADAKEGKISVEEALKIVLKHYQFLDPVQWLFFSHDTGLTDKLSYAEYAAIMISRAKKLKNTQLLAYAKSALIVGKELRL